jgi:RNA polymerase sigma factor (TIGR02999 family)
VGTDPKKAEAPDPSNVTALLNRMRTGDRAAGDEVAGLVYSELHRIASREMRHEREGHTLQTTALVHEAYMRLAGSQSLEIQNRGHFFAVASRQMRRILVDHARSGGAQRRGGAAIKVELDKLHIAAAERSIDVILLDESLRELERLEPRAAKVVELRYFGGYTDKEVVEALGVSLATVRREWEFARSWLFDHMQGKRKP